MLLLWIQAARAAVPFQLPDGEVVADWAAPLALAGFAPGPAGAAPSAIITPEDGVWRLVVVDASGERHTTRVTPPHSRRERENLVWVAQSLLDPMVPGFAAAGPPPPPRPPRAAPRAAAPKTTAPIPAASEPIPAAPIPPPAPIVLEPALEPVDPIAPQPTPAAPQPTAAASQPAPAGATVPAVRAPRIQPRASAAGGARVRDRVETAPFVTVSGGVAGAGWDAQLTVTELLPARLDTSGLADAEVAGERGLLELRVGPEWGIAPRAGLGLGMAHHRFHQGDTTVAAAWVPVLSAAATLRVRAGHALAIELTTRATWDTRALDLRVDGAPVRGWSAWGVEPGLAMVYAPE